MAKHDTPFVEHVFRLYVPEGSPLFDEWLERIEASEAYQIGLRDGMSIRKQGKARSNLKKVHGGPGNV